MNKNRKTIPQGTKIRASLQKEINSICPFCFNEDVGHFQIHHIDEDPSNNDIGNLLLFVQIAILKLQKGIFLRKTLLKRNKIFFFKTILRLHQLMLIQKIVAGKNKRIIQPLFSKMIQKSLLFQFSLLL
jgi:hypothetical protein